MGSSIAWHLKSRSRLHRQASPCRARSELCPRLVGALGELDPPAVLDAAQHSPLALRHRLPAPGPRGPGRRSRAEGAGLSLPRLGGGRGGAARQPCDPEGRRLRRRAARSGRAGAALPGDVGGRGGARLARHRQRRLVRRAGADGRPSAARRASLARVRRRRGRGPGAECRHPALRRADRGGDDRARSRAAGRARSRPPPASRCRSSRAAARSSCSIAASSLPLLPLTIDPSGMWFRPEGRFYLGGTTPADGQRSARRAAGSAACQEWDDRVWPVLAERVPAFAAAKVVNSWAGYYEYNTFDQNGIVGRHPEHDSLYLRHRLLGPRHPAVACGRPRRGRADRARQLPHPGSFAVQL